MAGEGGVSSREEGGGIEETETMRRLHIWRTNVLTRFRAEHGVDHSSGSFVLLFKSAVLRIVVHAQLMLSNLSGPPGEEGRDDTAAVGW